METEQELRARILGRLSEERVPINIAPEARDALREYLVRDRAGTGEGYSEFILRAIELRRAQAKSEA